MMKSYPYQIVGTREREESLFFMLDALLRSRIETGEETFDDEDVNVYLAGLLHAFLDKSFFLKNRGCLSRYTTDVFAWAEESGDLRTKYRVYKGNADYTLVGMGIFEEPFCRTATWQAAELEAKSAVARGKLYYRFASNCNVRLARKKTGLSEVLEKLSERFETYLKILGHMRAGYLNLLRRLSRGEMFHLQRKVQEGATTRVSHEGRDHFLDAYADWLRSGSKEDRNRVNRLGKELSRIDPEFGFDGI
jgi:hypothetical protein